MTINEIKKTIQKQMRSLTEIMKRNQINSRGEEYNEWKFQNAVESTNNRMDQIEDSNCNLECRHFDIIQ